MTWQLTLASCAAANLKPGLPPDPDPAADVAVEWDATLLGANLALSNSNRDVTNNGANNSSGIVTALKPIRPTDGIVYWEVLISALGAATDSFEIGFLSEYSKGIIASTDLGGQFRGGIIIQDGSSNATIVRGGNNYVTGLTNIRTAGLTINFALDAGSGKFWVGRNGVWYNGAFGAADPDTGVPTGYVQPGVVYWPVVRPRDNGDVFRLQSIASHFGYTKPAAAKAYGSDLVNFIRHELPVFNNGWENGLTGWTIESGGSTTFGTTLFNFGVDFGTLYSSVQGYEYFEGSGNRTVVVPNQAAAAWGGIWQEHTFDTRFNDLIDNNEMILEMSMWLSKALSAAGLSLDPCLMCAEFYDGSNTIIGSTNVGSGKDAPTGAREKHLQYFAVPALTRKIRVIWRISKTAGSATRRWAMSQPKAALLRKIPLVRVDVGGDVNVVLGKPQGVLGVRSSNLFVISTPDPEILLLHFDGSDGATTTTDSSQYGRTFTFVGNAQLDTAQSKFGGSSLLLDGSGDRLTHPTNDIWHFGIDAFTVEAQVRFNGGVTNQAFFGKWQGGNSWFFYMDTGSLRFRLNDAGTLRDVAYAWTPSTGVWYHVAFDRTADGVGRLYIDGVMVAKVTNYGYSVPASTEPFVIGAIGNTNTFPTYDFNGWIDEIRILRGLAAWGTDAGFTAPTAAYT